MQASKLKDQQRALRDTLPEAHAVRLWRASSWLECAEAQQGNLDLQFISLWIAFNACYSVDEEKPQNIGERDLFQRFTHKLVKHDATGKIHQTLMQTYSGPIRTLITNQHVFAPFWDAQRLIANNEPDTTEWKTRFDKASKTAMLFLMEKKVPELLSVVLDRLYVLRNQLMHGGATWNSSVNRAQVRDGRALLARLLPVMLGVMMSNPVQFDGRPFYPVVKD